MNLTLPNEKVPRYAVLWAVCERRSDCDAALRQLHTRYVGASWQWCPGPSLPRSQSVRRWDHVLRAPMGRSLTGEVSRAPMGRSLTCADGAMSHVRRWGDVSRAPMGRCLACADGAMFHVRRWDEVSLTLMGRRHTCVDGAMSYVRRWVQLSRVPIGTDST